MGAGRAPHPAPWIARCKARPRPSCALHPSELTLRSLPKDPGTGNSWFDTSVHGSLTAEPPLGADPPGRPGDTVNPALAF